MGSMCELDGCLMLDKANGPERGDADKCGNGPTPATKGWAACAYLAADQAEERWRDESDQKNKKEDWLEDKDEGAGVPAWIKGKEGAEAVVVGPVQQKMTKQGDEREAIKQTPAYRGTGRLGRGDSSRTPAMEEPDSAGDDRRLEWEAEEGVGPSAVMLESSNGAVEGPEAVEVGDFGCWGHGDGGVGCLSVEVGAGMGDSGTWGGSG